MVSEISITIRIEIKLLQIIIMFCNSTTEMQQFFDDILSSAIKKALYQ